MKYTDLPPRLQRAIRRLSCDPVFFAQLILGIRPWSLQAEVLHALADHPRVAVAGAHGVGKGLTAAIAALWFLFTRPKAIVLSTAPTERQVRRLLWGEIHVRYHNARLPLGGTLRPLAIEISDDWYALGFCAVGPDQFQGFHAAQLLVIVDEAAGVPDAIFDGVEAVLTGAASKLLLIGNPTRPRGPFHAACHSDRYQVIRIPATAHPNVTGESAAISAGPSADWIMHVREVYGESSNYFRSRVLAQFPTEDLDQLVDQVWIDAAAARAQGAPGPRALGVDVARFGRDSTVLAGVRGGTVTFLKSARGRDTVQVTHMVTAAIHDLGISPDQVSVDDTGVGGGVTDQLRHANLDVAGVQFGARPHEERFANRTSELLWRLRELLRIGALALGQVTAGRDRDILLEQLALLSMDYTPAGTLRITGEPGHHAAPSTSPDHVVALALALRRLHPRTLAAESASPLDPSDAAGLWFS